VQQPQEEGQEDEKLQESAKPQEEKQVWRPVTEVGKDGSRRMLRMKVRIDAGDTLDTLAAVTGLPRKALLFANGGKEKLDPKKGTLDVVLSIPEKALDVMPKETRQIIDAAPLWTSPPWYDQFVPRNPFVLGSLGAGAVIALSTAVRWALEHSPKAKAVAAAKAKIQAEREALIEKQAKEFANINVNNSKQLSQLAKDLVARTKKTGRKFSSEPQADMQAALELMTQDDMNLLHDAVGPESCEEESEPRLHQGPVPLDQSPLTEREVSALQQQDALGRAILKRASLESGLMSPAEADEKFGKPERSLEDSDSVGYSAAREVGKPGKNGTWMSASTVQVRKPATDDTATAAAAKSSPVDKSQQPLNRASPAEDAATADSVAKSSSVSNSQQLPPRAGLDADEGSAGRAKAGVGDSAQAEAGLQPPGRDSSSALSEPREQEGKSSGAGEAGKSHDSEAAEDSSEAAFKVTASVLTRTQWTSLRSLTFVENRDTAEALTVGLLRQDGAILAFETDKDAEAFLLYAWSTSDGSDLHQVQCNPTQLLLRAARQKLGILVVPENGVPIKTDVIVQADTIAEFYRTLFSRGRLLDAVAVRSLSFDQSTAPPPTGADAPASDAIIDVTEEEATQTVQLNIEGIDFDGSEAADAGTSTADGTETAAAPTADIAADLLSEAAERMQSSRDPVDGSTESPTGSADGPVWDDDDGPMFERNMYTRNSSTSSTDHGTSRKPAWAEMASGPAQRGSPRGTGPEAEFKKLSLIVPKAEWEMRKILSIPLIGQRGDKPEDFTFVATSFNEELSPISEDRIVAFAGPVKEDPAREFLLSDPATPQDVQLHIIMLPPWEAKKLEADVGMPLLVVRGELLAQLPEEGGGKVNMDRVRDTVMGLGGKK